MILFVRFQQVKDFGEVNQKFELGELQDGLDGQRQAQRLVDFAAQAVHLSGDSEVGENDMNEGLGCIRALVGKTAAATSALSVGTNGRDSNDLKYLQEALCLIDGLLCRDARDDLEVVTAEKTPSPVSRGSLSFSLSLFLSLSFSLCLSYTQAPPPTSVRASLQSACLHSRVASCGRADNSGVPNCLFDPLP